MLILNELQASQIITQQKALPALRQDGQPSTGRAENWQNYFRSCIQSWGASLIFGLDGVGGLWGSNDFL